jgi:hypothetical protein
MTIRKAWLAVLGSVLVVASACGVDEPANADIFVDEATRILQKASDEYARLADLVPTIDPAAPVPQRFSDQMLAVADADRKAASEIEALQTPVEAQQRIEDLVNALRDRADAFERLASAGLTLEQLENDAEGTDAEDRLDGALEAMSNAGWLHPDAESHD